jgi:hypothetical protein
LNEMANNFSIHEYDEDYRMDYAATEFKKWY